MHSGKDVRTTNKFFLAKEFSRSSQPFFYRGREYKKRIMLNFGGVFVCAFAIAQERTCACLQRYQARRRFQLLEEFQRRLLNSPDLRRCRTHPRPKRCALFSLMKKSKTCDTVMRSGNAGDGSHHITDRSVMQIVRQRLVNFIAIGHADNIIETAGKNGMREKRRVVFVEYFLHRQFFI